MIVEAQVTIEGRPAAVWAAVTDLENASSRIRAIERIEVIERPERGLVGLKWRETRFLFGKPATVEKWITDAKENEFFTTRASDGSFAFLTTHRISERGSGTALTGIHETRPQGLVARLKALPLPLFRGAIRKAILQDLNDIKAAVERA